MKQKKTKTTKKYIKILILCKKHSKLMRLTRYTKILSLTKIYSEHLLLIRIKRKIITKTH
jgi:hypothetical protein